MKPLAAALAAVLCAATLVTAQAVRDAVPSLPLRLSGTVISSGLPGNPTGTARLELTIERWSPPAARQTLLSAVGGSDQEHLLRTLQAQPSVGTIRFNTNLGWELYYAHVVPGEDGRARIFLATDRPVSAWEVWNQPLYANYPLTLINLELDRDGRGNGSLILAARVTAYDDGRMVEVENYAAAPIPINDIQPR